MCFFHSAPQAYLEQHDPFSTMKTMIFRMHSFQKLTQFSQGNSVPQPPASNSGAFLGAIHVFPHRS
jgi:hypothetical protein